jgi:hypothetical protein
MNHQTACGIRQVLSELDWDKFPQRVGDDLLKNPRALANLLSQIMNGEVRFSPDRQRESDSKKEGKEEVADPVSA